MRDRGLDLLTDPLHGIAAEGTPQVQIDPGDGVILAFEIQDAGAQLVGGFRATLIAARIDDFSTAARRSAANAGQASTIDKAKSRYVLTR